MIKVVVKKLVKTPAWGRVFNHTIKLNDKKNTKFLDLFVV